MKKLHLLFFFLMMCAQTVSLYSINNASVFTHRPEDPKAIYFTPENYPIKADGKTDVSEALQEAIMNVKRSEMGYGILFVPEGNYLISKTIYIPMGVRVIGYGSKRPTFVLGKNTPGFQEVTQESSKGKYMFWFVNGLPTANRPASDANASTFYSSLINVDIKIEDGNPNAVGIRAHFAQHCSISHVNIYIGKGRAGIVDTGNHMENIGLYGGEYGINTVKSSPGWPIMLLNSYFEGQRKAAILTSEGGLTIVRMHAKNVPVAVEIRDDSPDRLYMEDCIFENVKNSGLILTNAGNSATQINLRDIQCENVPVFSLERFTGKQEISKERRYKVNHFIYGFNMDNLETEPEVIRLAELEKISSITPLDASDTPLLPSVDQWINIRDLGAKGDGFSDDTQIFLEAIEKYPNIYIPQGWYVVKEPMLLKQNTNIIGLHPATTVILAMGGNPAFSGFGSPQAQLTTPKGGTNIVTGIYLNADAYNYRAVNCKWMAGENSYMYDVKFSGHDKDRFTYNGQRASIPLDEPLTNTNDLHNLITRAWDNQHWSLWITDGGGGTFRDIWTANEYSSTGLYVSNTATPGRIYGMSLEHHLRNEATFRNVSNWKIYDFQFEVEAEGIDSQPLDLVNCENMLFANFYSYRVSRMLKSYPSGVRTWNCRNIEFLNVHNYAHARVKFTSNATLYDVNTRREARQWELARLVVSGNESRKYPLSGEKGKVEQVVTGFEFADGLTRDSKGNIYFCEHRMRRIYKLDIQTGQVTSIADFPWDAVALACDTKDNLIVVTKYIAQPGYKNDDTRDGNKALFGWKGSGGLWGFTYVPKLYSINPDHADATFKVLDLVPMSSVTNPQKVYYPGNRTISYNEYYRNTKPENCFIAEDGVTIIPYYEDLFRCSSLVEAKTGKPVYSIDEYHQRVVRSIINAQGFLENNEVIIERGDRGITTDSKGNIYVSSGDVLVFDPQGNRIGTIEVPERAASILISEDTLYITAITSLYQVRL
ncbi:SMP-30/gluconolactonase/LRE family protein [Parabacteroides sp. OttesenSCG-928-G07]|nr:SMP-30/gluconolactonase/LRE family protein [Parabacteroides sp. OttesenSCG-928-G21]MDL2278031.1 SMP-30/gluconolactonase/LRE family protein [Parabacteroides sp. OttesenSCG-928-G07]